MTNHIIHMHEKRLMLVLTVSRTSAMTWAEEIWFPLWSRRTVIRSQRGCGLAVKQHRPIQRILISHGEVVGAFSHEHREQGSFCLLGPLCPFLALLTQSHHLRFSPEPLVCLSFPMFLPWSSLLEVSQMAITIERFLFTLPRRG